MTTLVVASKDARVERLGAAETQVLEYLEREDWTPVSRIPTHWPLIRLHLPLVLERLREAGLVAYLPSVFDLRPALVGLTGRGRTAVRAMRGSAER